MRTLDSLDRICKNFYGDQLRRNSSHILSVGKKSQGLRMMGGLGLQAGKPKNLALLSKLNWRLKVQKDMPWFLVVIIGTPNLPCSRTWTAIKKDQSVFIKGTKWMVGSSLINGLLMVMGHYGAWLLDFYLLERKKLRIKEVAYEGLWNFNICSIVVSIDLVLPINFFDYDLCSWLGGTLVALLYIRGLSSLGMYSFV